MKPRIAMVGSVNMDLVFHTERMPAPGETVEGSGFHQIPGGKGANQAVAAARQGADASFIGCVGDDAFGSRLHQGLAGAGLELRHLTTVTDTPTGVAAILLDQEGDNRIVLAPGANHALSIAHILSAEQTIASAGLLVCQLETPLKTVECAIGIARRNGVPVILNAAPVQHGTAALLGQADYLIVNETEASQLSGIEVTGREAAMRAAHELIQRGAGTVLLTMGAHGVLVAEPGAARFVRAVPVAVVDTTAAGDTFVGVFAAALMRGLSLFDAVTEAQYAAALAVTKLGAQTSIPFRSELELFKKNQAAR